MGTKVAPTYATLVLGLLEKNMYETVKMEKDENNYRISFLLSVICTVFTFYVSK